MLTVRLHLDPCGPDNGPLRVLPGTHRCGRLNAGAIQALREEVPEVVCAVGAGDAVLMRPLLLHASSAAQAPSRRRVLHIEWANRSLPGGLEWFERIGAPDRAPV
jgi:ectoine hydroxylase-related dioxygenase (phytanoyl-CoA dioxygenase family)